MELGRHERQWQTYGKRTDGPYGPIIGTPYEMSHFKKFRTVALDTANFPPTYPIVSNVTTDELSNPVAISKLALFDTAYSILLDALELTFRQPAGPEAPDPFYTLALPLMHKTLPDLARALMQTPIHSDGDASVGPNAAPSFRYRPGCALADLGEEIQETISMASKAARGSASST